MKIKIKVVGPSGEKIRRIKLLRAAFGMGLKEAKDFADQFDAHETAILDTKNKKYSIKELNQNHSKDATGEKLLEYLPQYSEVDGFSCEALLEKIRFFAGLALDNDETHLAEDLIHVYNKHIDV